MQEWCRRICWKYTLLCKVNSATPECKFTYMHHWLQDRKLMLHIPVHIITTRSSRTNCILSYSVSGLLLRKIRILIIISQHKINKCYKKAQVSVALSLILDCTKKKKKKLLPQQRLRFLST